MFHCIDVLYNEHERRDTGSTVVMGGEVLQMGLSMTYPHIYKTSFANLNVRNV
jgi:hypothetical protein